MPWKISLLRDILWFNGCSSSFAKVLNYWYVSAGWVLHCPFQCVLDRDVPRLLQVATGICACDVQCWCMRDKIRWDDLVWSSPSYVVAPLLIHRWKEIFPLRKTSCLHSPSRHLDWLFLQGWHTNDVVFDEVDELYYHLLIPEASGAARKRKARSTESRISSWKVLILMSCCSCADVDLRLEGMTSSDSLGIGRSWIWKVQRNFLGIDEKAGE